MEEELFQAIQLSQGLGDGAFLRSKGIEREVAGAVVGIIVRRGLRK